MDFIYNLNEENVKDRQANDETIYIDTANCEDVNDFIKIINFTNSVLYMKKEENDYSYVIKRLLDNEKKYECRNLFDELLYTLSFIFLKLSLFNQ